MNTNETNIIRAAAKIVTQDGNYKVVVETKVGDKIFKSCKMHSLTEERAKEYAAYYSGGKVEKM